MVIVGSIAERMNVCKYICMYVSWIRVWYICIVRNYRFPSSPTVALVYWRQFPFF